MAQTVAELNVKITAQMDDVKKGLANLKGEMTKAEKEVTKTSDTISKSIKGIGTALIAMGAVKAAKDLVLLAGEVDSVSTAFQSLAANAEGGSQGLLESVKIATNGTVDNLNLMKTSNLALQLMGEDVAQHLPQMAKIAAAAARTQGKSVEQMYSDIVVATGRQSVLILDNLGISSATASQKIEEYARSLGKTRDQLTDAEKKQAFFNAVMAAGGDIVKKAGGDVVTLGESLQQLKAFFADLGVEVAEKVTPYIKKLADTLRDLKKEWDWYRSKDPNDIIKERIMDDDGGYVERTRTRDSNEWAVAQYDAAGNVVKMWNEAEKKVTDSKRKISSPGKTTTTTSTGKKPFVQDMESFREMEAEYNQRVYDMTQKALSTAQGITSQMGGIFNQYMTNKNMQLENEHHRGLERIQEQYDAEKANIEATVFDEKEKAEKLKALDEKRARDEKKLNEKIEKERRKVAREAAIYQKAIGITQSIINTSIGVTSALGAQPWGTWNIALASLVGAMGAAQTALIAAQPLPELAEGGLFTGPAIVAEKGREMALPLDGDEGRAAIREMSAGIVDTLATVENGVSSQPQVSGNVYLDGTYVGQWLNGALDNGQIVVPARVVR